MKNMANKIINVLIVDDEQIVREGLRYIIDWNTLGFCICGEAANGEDALEMIRQYRPGLVLLDIRMSGMLGTELMEKARSEGFSGAFIILSGYSDFKYAQTALQFGASYYLTKPIDEDELEKAVQDVHEKIEFQLNSETSRNQYLKKAKTTVLYDLLTGNDFNPSIDYQELGLSYPIYQVLIYESYMPYFRSYSFSDLLRVTNKDNNSFEHVNIDNHDIILLKGNFALERLNACLHHYDKGTQKGSPLDTIFLIYGPTVSSLSQIHESYELCQRLLSRRFFCGENQHVLSYEELPAENFRLRKSGRRKNQDITARYLPITLKPVISAGFPKFSKICDSFFLIVTVMYRVSNIFWQIFFWRSNRRSHTRTATPVSRLYIMRRS
mgnify:CR=1 FL=1